MKIPSIDQNWGYPHDLGHILLKVAIKDHNVRVLVFEFPCHVAMNHDKSIRRK